MHDTDDIGSNPTDNRHIEEIISARVSRRQVLGGGAATAALGFLAGCKPVLSGVPGNPGKPGKPGKPGHPGQPGTGLGFTEVLPSTDDTIHVPEGYTWHTLIPWGTPLVKGAPEWRKDASNTAADQALQVGFNHDGMHYFPLSNGAAGSKRGLLVLNHEYIDASQIYTAAQGSAITNDAAGREKVAKALAAHGVSVVEVRQKHDGSWEHVKGSKYNRRVTGTTPMAFSGPVTPDHPMLQSELGNAPTGTLNNCAHGYTPWGTYLAAEENWNGYFGTDDPAWTPTALEARYGVSARGFDYYWHRAEARFDLAQNRNELNHFGWVVEIDPNDPTSTPVKRTALGRIKHEGATVTEQDGRVVVYSGDDENGDYLYKFVGNAPWRDLIRQGKSPLDHGDLFVAKFNDDGTGTWITIRHNKGVLHKGNGWKDQADVLIRTRQAADAVGATRLHRPEWVDVNRNTGDVYVTLTNGTGNLSLPNSERDPNPYGHILRFKETSVNVNHPYDFEWDVFVYAGDPAYPALEGGKVPEDQPVFGSPDGIWVDPDGLVWIQTDISNSSQNLASRGYDNIGNNQMLVADPNTGKMKRFLTGPRGCEITGVITTPDQKTMFINVQHPGESTTFWGPPPTTDNPTAVSNFPDFDPTGRPRPTTVVIRKADGGKIGS